MQLASTETLAYIAFITTKGVYPSVEEEAHGMEAIAQCAKLEKKKKS